MRAAEFFSRARERLTLDVPAGFADPNVIPRHDQQDADPAVGEKMFEAVCALGLEGIVSKRLRSVYRSGPSKSWIKISNPKAPAATRVEDGTF
jgi:ATP-dependent DNA ligase